MEAIKVGTKDVLGTLQVEVRVSREFRIRVAVAVFLIKLAGFVSGGFMEIKVVNPKTAKKKKAKAKA